MWIGQGKYTALNNIRLVVTTCAIKILDLIIRFVIYTIWFYPMMIGYPTFKYHWLPERKAAAIHWK